MWQTNHFAWAWPEIFDSDPIFKTESNILGPVFIWIPYQNVSDPDINNWVLDPPHRQKQLKTSTGTDFGIEFGSRSRILAQFGSGSGYRSRSRSRVKLLILKKNKLK